MVKQRYLSFILIGVIFMGIVSVCDISAAENIMESAIQTLQQQGIKEDHDGMLILKRYAHYFSEINQGNAYGHWDVAGGKQNPPVYDFVAFSVMAYKGTVDKIVENTLAGKDAFEGLTGLLERAYISEVDQVLDSYILYVPKNYDATRKYPLVVMLHGLGEGAYLAVTTSSHQPFLEACEAHQFIMVAPNGKNHPDLDLQHPTWGASFYANEGEQDVLQVIKLAQKAYNIDEKRIYLTGCSMGGYGTWHVGSRQTDLFAAIAPVCGVGSGLAGHFKIPVIDVNLLKNTPVYVFHGNIDPTVPVTESRELVNGLREIGADVTYEEFPGVQHNAWDFAYNNDRLWQWFLKHPKP
ncbi:hypothetical protein GobsU_14599 [Candidatus Vecturithrix granuli]|uniref:Phospholipase/carboxylesterase/thioesterase domain-containing protein n=1 Tax=Vecturithrix granuli TaxID=1499967 RepID=A0A081C6B8_VECG1|nr:hypothetical protein GobsU_14599 [Candidatus Vecturithrix granuli]